MELRNTFFITGLGRSGTMFLARLMTQSLRFSVVHEVQRPWWNPMHRDRELKHFPWRRFAAKALLGGGYGEVNSYLRHVLSPDHTGPEALVPKRGIIFRDPKQVVASAMNRPGPERDFESMCERVLPSYARLCALRLHPSLRYRSFLFERVTTDSSYAKTVLHWAGIEDVDVCPGDLHVRVNTNKQADFPGPKDWPSELVSTYERCSAQMVPPEHAWENTRNQVLAEERVTRRMR